MEKYVIGTVLMLYYYYIVEGRRSKCAIVQLSLDEPYLARLCVQGGRVQGGPGTRRAETVGSDWADRA